MPNSRSSRRKMRNCGRDWSLSSLLLRLYVINLRKLYRSWLVWFRMVWIFKFPLFTFCFFIFYFFHLIFLLTSLLVHLADIAEKDKETLENKLSASSKTLDSLSKQMDGLSLKLDSAQETIRTRKFFSV